MKLECNIFKGVYDQDCSNVVSFNAVLKGIKEGRWKDVILALRKEEDKDKFKQLKFSLPAVTWSGVFEERLDDAYVVYNNVMVVDIDTITKTRLERLKIELRQNPWVYAFFDGPSKGIKILIFIDSEVEWHNTHAFEYVEQAFKDFYSIQIDKSGKNISRLCFVSYDPDLYINPNPQALHIEKMQDEFGDFESLKTFNYDNAVQSYDARHIFDVCVKMVRKSKTGNYHKGNRNNFIFVLSCLCSGYGIPPEMAFSFIMERYKSLGVKEIRRTIESAYRRTKHDFGTKTLNRRSNQNQNTLL